MSIITPEDALTIRSATSADHARLAALAGRDSATVPSGPLMVAEVAGTIRAALALDSGRVIADPFHRTTELVDLLRLRAVSHARRRGELRIVAQSSGWRRTGLRLADASSRRRTGVV
jgi:hypothetical protein